MFKNLLGIFARAQDLRGDPLLVDGIGSAESIDWSRYSKFFGKRGFEYVGPEQDIENFRKDFDNWKMDFNKAFQAAKSRLGV